MQNVGTNVGINVGTNVDRGQTQCRHGSGPVTELACVFLIPCRKVIFCNLVEKLGFFLENE